MEISSQERTEILGQIKAEYDLGFAYVQRKRQQYRQRIEKDGPQGATKLPYKVNINLIANISHTNIAAMWVNGIKTKFISRDGWIGQEEAENLTQAYKFDTQEQQYQQVNYQIEQDSDFFGVGIANLVGFDKVKCSPIFRPLNPLSWIPDPIPTKTGDFSAENYRFHGFMMTGNVWDLKNREDFRIPEINMWIKYTYDTDKSQTRQAYADRSNLGNVATLDTCQNFSMDFYNHYFTWKGKKYIAVTDANRQFLFKIEPLKPILVEEKADNENVPFPIALNYSDPEEGNPFGRSLWDKLEDKQNAISVLTNLSIMKAKKEALGGTYLVNSRLIKNRAELNKPTTDTRYIFMDEKAPVEANPRDAMYELPSSAISGDVFQMIDRLKQEAVNDSGVDQLQQGVTPTKAMTKAETQTIQANANLSLALKNGVKSWYYKQLSFLRWRAYQDPANWAAGQKKMMAINVNFEWSSITYTKDKLALKQQPHIITGTTDDIEAIDEKNRLYINQILPVLLNNPQLPQVSKLFAQRVAHRLNGLPESQVYILCPMTPDERRAKDFVLMLNNELMPKSVFDNPNADLFTFYLYIQKAEDSKMKAKLMYVLEQAMIDRGMQQGMQTTNAVANTSANIMMSQNSQQSTDDVVSRGDLQSNNQL